MIALFMNENIFAFSHPMEALVLFIVRHLNETASTLYFNVAKCR
jgi:hypothetical protein